MNFRSPRSADSKILDLAVAVARFGPASGGRTVFTNGCFDLVHRGHVEYLAQARALGEALVVGLNTDRSVRELKGSARPLMQEMDRARVLAALEVVDAVVLFDEETPATLIAGLRPDVLVKGGDYTLDEVVGRDTVEAAGGVVRIIPFLDGYSTTDLLDRLERLRRGNS